MTSVRSRHTALLVDHLEARRDAMMSMLEVFVNHDSQWLNTAGVESMGSMVAGELEKIGFRVEYTPQPGIPPDRRWLAELLAPGVRYEDLAGTFRATSPGDGSDQVLFLGDLDTALGVADSRRFSLDGAKAIGNGIADMKAGLVSLLWALRALHELEIPRPSVDLVLSGDEQAGSLGSSSTIREAARSAPWTLCVECARNGGNLMISRGHIGVARIDAHGRAAHAGTERSSGVNAIEALARLIPALNDIVDEDAGILVTVTRVEGGMRRSVVPPHASAVLDVRARDQSAWKRLEAEVERVVAMPGEEGAVVDLRIAAHRPGVSLVPRAAALIDRAREIAADIGFHFGTVTSMAAGSSAFAAEVGSAVVDGLGPSGGALMTDAEYVVASDLVQRTALLAGLTADLADSHRHEMTEPTERRQ